MGPVVIVLAIGAAFGLFGCGSDTSGVKDGRVRDPDGGDGSDGRDIIRADGPEPSLDGDRYVDGGDGGGGDSGDGGLDRTGINDSYAPLPFCSGRNIFTIQGNTGVGFCSEDPVVLYKFPISDDISTSVVAEEMRELPAAIGGRAVLPTTIRDGGERRILLPMMHPSADTAVTFLMADISAGEFIGPQVNATGIQVGTQNIGDPIPANGLTDLALIGGEFWGTISNPIGDGTYALGFGLVLPQTIEGFVDPGIPPNEEGIVARILSNRREEIEDGEGTHFGFITPHKKPTNVESLGDGLIAVQSSGADGEPASIDIASQETHAILAERTVSLGGRELTVLPRLAVHLSAMRAYPATETSLWEVDLSEGAPSEQENEIALAASLTGQIGSVVIRSGQAVVGDSDGKILFVGLSDAMWGEVVRTIDVGSDLTWVAADTSGNLFAAVGATVEEAAPHIVSINPDLLN